MNEIREAMEQATTALGVLARVDFVNLSDDDLVAVVGATEHVGRFLDTARALEAAEVADRSEWALGDRGLSMRFSYRRPAEFLQDLTKASKSEVTRRMLLGRDVRPRPSFSGVLDEPTRPVLAEAMRSGEIGVDSAAVIAANLHAARVGVEATRENMEAAETELVNHARGGVADDVATLARSWRDALDPDGLEPRDEAIRSRRGVIVGRERNGIKRYVVNAGPILAAELDAVFMDSRDPKAQPRFMSEQDIATGTVITVDANGEIVETITDPRTPEQKRADILEGVIVAGLKSTGVGDQTQRTIGQVTATIRLEDLLSGKGFGVVDGIDEVIPASVVQQLVCDSGFFPIVTDSTGFPLYHGPLKRSFTAAQRRAIVVRDGDRCIGPGCHAPGSRAQAHHVTFFSEGGPTDITDGVLLCPSCHHALHSEAFQLKMVDGHPWIRLGTERWDDTAWRPAGKSRLRPVLPS